MAVAEKTKYKVGTDLASPKRIAKTYAEFGDKFLDRILTEKEKEYVLSEKAHMITRLTARYAAKEAVSKALGTGIREGINFKDIEVVRGEKNAPSIKLYGEAAREAEKQDLTNWSVSISHEDILVVATVIVS